MKGAAGIPRGLVVVVDASDGLEILDVGSVIKFERLYPPRSSSKNQYAIYYLGSVSAIVQ